jgi:hypothetical protein
MNKSLREEEKKFAKKRQNIFEEFHILVFLLIFLFEKMIHKFIFFGGFGISNCHESSPL